MGGKIEKMWQFSDMPAIKRGLLNAPAVKIDHYFLQCNSSFLEVTPGFFIC